MFRAMGIPLKGGVRDFEERDATSKSRRRSGERIDGEEAVAGAGSDRGKQILNGGDITVVRRWWGDVQASGARKRGGAGSVFRYAADRGFLVSRSGGAEPNWLLRTLAGGVRGSAAAGES